MASTLNRFLERLQATIRECSDGSTQIDSASEQLATTSRSVASGATQQAASLEEVNAALKEVSSHAERTAQIAQGAKSTSDRSIEMASTGRKAMEELQTAMAAIAKSSQDISGFIQEIDTIAFQTNLLALNAAVEAARAGDAGKGFAVVAEEVRNLAQRSSGMSRQASQMIGEADARTQRGVEIVGRALDSFGAITTSAESVHTSLNEIAQSATEQDANMRQVATGVDDLEKVTQQNAASSEELAAAAQGTTEQINTLRRLLGQFQV